MDKRKIHVLGILMIVAIASESSVIYRRRAPSLSGAGDEEFNKDKTRGWSPEIWESPDLNIGKYDTGMEPEDNDIANEIFTGKPGAKPERYPSYSDLGEEPDDGDEDVNDIHGNDDDVYDQKDDVDEEDEIDMRNDEDVYDQKDDGDEEDEKDIHGNDEKVYDQKDNVPLYAHEADFDVPEKGLFGAGSIFDTPFFDLRKARKYFDQLERALAHAFKETLEEARLLNGTYANTTEEEVDINGKKYVVQKSLIQGGDNRSSIYVETLSSKRKEDGGEGTNGMEVSKNETYN